MTRPLSLLLLAIFAGIGLVVVVGKAVFPYKYRGSLIDPPIQAAGFQLVDQHQQPFRLEDQRGKVNLVFFGYTHCPDVCPITLSEYKQVKAQLKGKADHVNFIFITIDPERDTPEVLHEHIDKFDPAFYALSGEPDQLEQVWKDYLVFREEVDSGSAAGYLVDHTSRVYVVDKKGDWRMTYTFGTPVEDVVQDVAHLVEER